MYISVATRDMEFGPRDSNVTLYSDTTEDLPAPGMVKTLQSSNVGVGGRDQHSHNQVSLSLHEGGN